MSEREVFMAAVSLTDPSRREAFLREACAGQEPLRQRVDALLQAHDAASSFMTTPAIEQALGTTKPDMAGTPSGHVNPADVTTKGNSEILEDLHADRTLSYLSPTDKPGALGRLGHYEVEAVLGRGGFGTVLRAFDERLHRTVAIKLLSPELAATSPPRKRFLREARAAAAIRHQNVVAIYAVEDLPIPYFVMECVPGQTLQQLLDAHGPLDVADVLSIGRQIAAGLAAAHVQGLVHRDIKPANILIEGGRTGIVRISDFGLARTADDASLTQSGTVAGTPLFMSPEQAVGRTIDQRSDLFSLGSVLYQMVTGHAPFRAGSMVSVLRRVVEDPPRPISETIPECPAWLSAIIAKLLAKSPDDRFQSAAEIADLLGRCLDDYRANRPVRLPAGIPPAPAALAAHESEFVAKADRPTTRRRAETSRRRSLLAAGVVCTVLALGVTEATGVTKLAATVIRLTTASGTLVIETDDPGIRVTIDGEEVQIRGAGVEQLTLKPGRYQVMASKDGQPVAQQLVTIAKGGREVVRITLEQDEPQSATATSVPPVADDTERRVAEWVLSKGGNVRFVIQRPGEYPQYREPKSTADFPAETFHSDIIFFPFGTQFNDAEIDRLLDAKKLDRLDLFRTNLTDAGLQTVSRMESLTYLNIGDTRVTDAGLPALRRLHRLRELSLFGLTVTAAGLRALEGLPLEGLEVGGTTLTGQDWQVFALFPGLKGMSFQECGGFNDTDLADLTNLSKLEGLHLGKTGISDAGLSKLAQFHKLSRIFLGYNLQLTDAAVDQLATVSSLRDLYIDHTGLTADGIDRLQRALPECRITWDGGVVEPASVSDRRAAEWALSIGVPVEVSVPGDRFRIAPGEPLPGDAFKLLFADLRVPEVKDAGLAHFAGCRNLTSLLLVGENITDAGVAHFRACKGLQELYLHNTSMTDAGLSNFDGCRDLTHLNISSRGFTDAGLAVFRDCHVRNLDLTLSQVTDAGLKQFHRIELLAGLQLPHTAVTDEGLSHFKSCALLGSLNLKETAVTDAGLAHLQNCAQLSHVVLENTAVGDAGLAALKHCHAISILVLNGTRVSDVGLAELRTLNNLKDLQLRRTGVTAARINELHEALPACRIEWDGGVIEPMASSDPDRRAAAWALSAGCSVELTAEGQRRRVQPGEPLPDAAFQLNWADVPANLATAENLAHFAGCQHLTHLNLAGEHVSDAGVEYFRDSKQLVRLALENTSVTDDGLAAFDGCRELDTLILNNSPVTDAGLRGFVGCEKMRNLQLAQTGITDAGLAHFANASQLTELVLSGTHITDAGLVHFRDCPELAHLNLVNTAVTDAGMEHFRNRPELSVLVLSNTRVSDAGLACFSASRKLVRLNLDNLGVTDAGLAHVRDCTQLTELTLFGAKITDTALEPLSRCSQLTYLLLDNTGITDAALAHLGECRQLQRLHLDNTRVGDAGLAQLANCDKLQQVTLANTKVSDAGLSIFADCAQLNWLNLYGTTVSNVGLGQLSGLPSLTEVDLRRTSVTASGIDTFRTSHPRCRMTWDQGVLEPAP